MNRHDDPDYIDPKFFLAWLIIGVIVVSVVVAYL